MKADRENNTIQVALVGCGGRGTGAASNALANKSGPIKLVAMADLFEERLNRSYETLKKAVDRVQGSADSWVMGVNAAQVDVPPERRFLGFNAYQQAMDCLNAGDVVIFATPVAFRWVHFRYAIQKGLHVFMEKPVSVDGPSTRKMLQLAEESKQKNLKVGVGLMCRHCQARWALYDRIKAGEIGDITLLQTYRPVGPAGFTEARTDKLNELLWQTKNYLLEWNDLIDAIRNDKPYNEVKRGTEASLTTIMGRMAVHTGQVITWDEALNHAHEFAPGLDLLTMESPAPLLAGADGKYPWPQPGRIGGREF